MCPRTRSPVTSVVFSSTSASSPRGLAPAHLDHDENGHGLIAIAKPTLTRKGKAFAFGAVQRGAKVLRESLRVTRGVGVCIPTERDRGFRRMMTAGSGDVDR